MFVGRMEELNALEDLYAKNDFQMLVLYGRRRVGKTALLEEFCKKKRALFFSAQLQSDGDNLKDFSREVALFFGLPASTPPFASWLDAFNFMAQKAINDPFVFVFDELPYAVRTNPALPSTLQVAIDRGFKKTQCLMVLCGSNQGFMENEVLGEKSPLYGRRTAQLRLLPFDYLDAARMLPDCPVQERISYYASLGGTPYYLAGVDPDLTYQQNMARLFFSRTGLMFDEPSMLLRQELREPATYSSIMRAIANGSNRSNEIASAAGVAPSSVTAYLKTLISLGLVERAVPHGEPAKSKRSIYRVKDPAFLFWYRFVAPHVTSIEGGLGEKICARLLANECRAEYEGHVFETVCRQWMLRQAAAGKLPLQVTTVDSWWGTDPVAREQTDIDLVASDEIDKDLLLGECKWRNKFDVSSVLGGLREKGRLLQGYRRQWFYVFSKYPVAVDSDLRLSDNVRSVCAEEMF